MAASKVHTVSSGSELPILLASPKIKLIKQNFVSNITSSRTFNETEGNKQMATKTPSLACSDDGHAFVAKPRFDSIALRTHFKRQMLELRDSPYELLEAQLYSASATNVLRLGAKPVNLAVIKSMHHIYELKLRESQLLPEEVAMLNQDLEKVIEENPMALDEYKCVVTLMKIASSLVVKWGLVSYDEYNYRLNGHAMNIRPLNLFTINTSLMTVETLWYSLVIEDEPLAEFIDIPTKQYAIVLRAEAERMLSFMLRMNTANFYRTPSISGYLSRLNPELHWKYHMQVEYDQDPPEYQELRQPEGLLARFHKSKSQANSLKLKKALRDFELAFRAFEKSLISCFMRKMLHLDEDDDVSH